MAGRKALWESGHDESVEVNQRALIDKVLARYSGEFTVFRELLQNSDDAQAKVVEIRFETQNFKEKANGEQTQGGGPGMVMEGLPNLKTAPVHHWTIRNDGRIFKDEDWARLKKIADGNPNEENVGAFGVGFYSVFSVTEEPLVTSGGRWMLFYWKDKQDQLVARRGNVPNYDAADPDRWTSVELALREAAPIPSPFDFTRFLASSITFMVHLSEVSVYFDDKRLARLTKTSGVPRALELPKGLRGTSRLGIMNVTGVKTTPLHVTAQVLRWVYSTGSEKPLPPSPIKPTKPSSHGGFFSSLFLNRSGANTPQHSAVALPVPAEVVDPLSVNETSVVLSIFSADVNVRLDQKMATELHRSMKKNPPSKLKYELIYTAKDEYDSSVKEDEQQPSASGSVFQGLRADLDGMGAARIFIGHATAQTVGLGGHMSARFIPTVERESIDLVDRHVAVWNRELLYVGGFLARIAYQLELDNIRNLWEGASSTASDSGPDPELRAWLCRRSLHALKFFAFHPSTPAADVSNLLEAAFFECQTNQLFPIISSIGIRNAADVRLPDSTFSSFLKNLPVVPEDVLKGTPRMINALQNRGMIKAITFVDVLNELRSRPLNETEMVACLQWWIALNKQGDNPNLAPIRIELLNAAVLMTGTAGGANERILPLSSVKAFINPKNIMGAAIPVDGPLPDHVIPLSVTKTFPPESLVSCLPWTELSIVDWLKHLITPAVATAGVEYDLTRSAPWAERVLVVLSRSWPSLSNGMKDHIAVLLKDKTCIPTSADLKIPEQAYFANVNIFHDLPIVTLPSGSPVKGSIEKVLQSLGVRKHVDLQVVFDRMIKTGDWTIADLTKYLVAVRSTLNDEEMQRLRLTAAFPSENGLANGKEQKPSRYRAKDLYEPLDIFRQLNLPVIGWGGQSKWRGSSDEAKFLFELGLQRFPPLEVIIHLCASSDATIRPIALKYLLSNISTRYPNYDPMNFADVPFIPAVSRMGTPKEVFGSPDWAALGFLVVQPSLQPDAILKLKIREHPPSPLLVDLLRKTPPKSNADARKWFEILAGRIAAFSPDELEQLSQMPMVPISDGQKIEGIPSVRWLSPRMCFFGGDSKARFHSKLFVFVDFGPLANGFLSACGTKREPSVEEVAQILLADPRKFYELAEGRDNFLVELRNLAVNSRHISSATLGKMKVSPVLLGMQRKVRTLPSGGRQRSNSIGIDDEEEDWDMQYDLKKPAQIVVADDIHAYQVFGDSVFTAPQEDILEGFYTQLGSRRLSSLVKEEYKTSSEVKDTNMAAEVRRLILERLPLFLHEHTHAATRVTYSWLNAGNNFVVKTFAKLTVTKTLNHGSVRLSRTQDASAAGKRIGYGAIQLWIAGTAQLDMYEIATSLCRLLFDAPKANDALLLMTILSTDLRSLKRRGYNVDRILRQQNAAKRAAEDAARQKAENTALLPPNPRDTMDMFPSPPPNQFPPSTSSFSSDPSAPPPLPNGDKTPVSSNPPYNLLQDWRRKFSSTVRGKHPEKRPPSQEENIGPSPNPRPTGPFRNRTVTPLSNISSNIDMAIRACTPETRNLVRNREQMQQVRESLNEGYCDISGRVGDLTLIGTMGEVKVFTSREVPDPTSILTTKREALARFIHVIRPLAQVYTLPLTTLHIFYDVAGDLIAFNRNASIFLNLRYFEAWHDESVRQGMLAPAYISWYFTLAHEIAHNLVQPHNSEHEFYFSAICEKYVLELGKLLAPER